MGSETIIAQWNEKNPTPCGPISKAIKRRKREKPFHSRVFSRTKQGFSSHAPTIHEVTDKKKNPEEPMKREKKLRKRKRKTQKLKSKRQMKNAEKTEEKVKGTEGSVGYTSHTPLTREPKKNPEEQMRNCFHLGLSEREIPKSDRVCSSFFIYFYFFHSVSQWFQSLYWWK